MWVESLLLVALVAGVRGQGEQVYCFTDDPDPYVGFSTKTAYNLARGEVTPEEIVPEGCEPRQIWHLVRHGTRYPSDDDTAAFLLTLPGLQIDILLAHQEGQGELCDGDLTLLTGWSIGALNMTWSSQLAPEGYRELEAIATRYKESLPLLLDQPFTNSSFKFRHTATQRTEASARSYALGLFGDDSAYIPEALDPDPLLRFYDVCSDYQTQVEDNPDATLETRLFEEGEEMTSVVFNVSRRLGVPLVLDEVLVLYDACRFYKAWDPPSAAAWCVVFTPDDLKVLEYWQDLDYYYTNGYGHAINYEMACPPVQDLLQHFSAVVEGQEEPSGVFHFSHSEALQPVMTRLGLFLDSKPLTHDHEDPDRLWRTSRHGSFATNVAFTLSSCGADQWWVSAAVSEQVVSLGGCASSLGCTWDEFIATYGQFLQCDLDAICHNTLTADLAISTSVN
ncbi:multiple inositol polyphosphate phosphatase 1 isoform X1 [Procambarus clarkii]|uniref:multiple inositol polyphosphate phosphatase 1 isoform X1 n=1 Tax=Procambarus clarkii TaxID=6728 RepID=UPI0037447BA9